MVNVFPVNVTAEVVALANHCSVEPGVPTPESSIAPLPQTEAGVVDTTEGNALMNTSTGTISDVHPAVRFLALT